LSVVETLRCAQSDKKHALLVIYTFRKGLPGIGNVFEASQLERRTVHTDN